MQDVVGFGDELHITILDAIVDHLDIVTGASWPEVGHTWLLVHLGGDGFKDRLDDLPRFRLAAGHDGRTPQRSFRSAADARSHVHDSIALQRFRTPLGVLKKRVASVDQQVPLLQQGLDVLDYRLHRRAGGDHHHNLARPLQCLDECLFRRAADQFLVFVRGHEVADLLRIDVVPGHPVTIALHVERQVLAHHTQANETYVSLIHIVPPPAILDPSNGTGFPQPYEPRGSPHLLVLPTRLLQLSMGQDNSD